MDKKIIVPNEVLLAEADRLLAEGREVELKPKGSSMLPFIREGRDSVVLRKAQEVAVGDIVLANLGARYVMHRIISREGESLTLMGDGNIRGTESCTVKDVLGTVTAIIRPGGKVITPTPARLWQALRPIRRYILAIYRRICL